MWLQFMANKNSLALVGSRNNISGRHEVKYFAGHLATSSSPNHKMAAIERDFRWENHFPLCPISYALSVVKNLSNFPLTGRSGGGV